MDLKNITKILLGIILTPIILIILLTVALYLPPVQKWVVDKVSAYASEETGMDIKVGGVHLAFPLDLSLEDVRCSKQNDSLPQLRDTIADIHQAIVDVQLLPLLHNNIIINAVEANQAYINTSDFIHEARIRGYVGRVMIDNVPPPVAHISLDSSMVRLSSIILDDTRLNVELSDTVPEDTTKTENLWKIYVKDLAVSNTDVTIHMPGDTLQIGASLKDMKAKEGFFDLYKGLYQVTHLSLNRSALAYDNNFEHHAISGFDANHIKLNNINLRVDSIYYCAPDVRMLVREAAMKEQSGIELKSMAANIDIDSTQMKVIGNMATPGSRLSLNYIMKPSPLKTVDLDNGYLYAKIDASLGRQDLMTFAMDGLPKQLRNNWPLHPLNIKGEMYGNLSEITIPWLNAELPTAFSVDAKGKARGFMQLVKNPYSNAFSAQMHANLKTYNLNFVKSMLARSTSRMINIPSMHATADVTARGANYDLALKAYEGKSTITANGKVNIASMNYDANVKATNINVGHFLKGYDNLNNIYADATINNSKMNVAVDSRNDLLNGKFTVNGMIGSKITDITMTTDLNKVDLYKLRIADVPLTIGMCSHLDLATDMNDYCKVQGIVTDISIKDTATTYHPDDIVLDVLTRRDTTITKVDCGDFALKMNAQGGYKKILGSAERIQKELARQYAERTIDQIRMRKVLPRMTVTMRSGQNNPVYRFAKYFGVNYSTIDLNMRTSQEDGIFGDILAYGVETQGYKLDTITANIKSSNAPCQMTYSGHIQNRPPNDFVFDAYFDGSLLEHGIDINTKLYDNKNSLALMIGAEATMEENGIQLHLTPRNPVLGYESFSLNSDNYVLLSKNNRIHANVDLLADDGTGVKVYCTDNDEEEYEDNDFLQDLTLSINRLDIGKIVASIPYAPNVKGLLNGDFHVMQNNDESLALVSDLTIQNMVYEGCPIGNLGSEFTYLPKDDGSHYIDGIITMDGNQVGTLTGSYNMKTEAINATMNMEHFPMQIINGFIPDKLIGLEGTAEGDITIHGSTKNPEVNGELYLQDAALLSIPYGVRLRFDDDPVRIHNSTLLLENFQMYAPNDEPLLVHGSVDFKDTEHISINMRMRASNFQLINAKENVNSEAYGSMHVNIMAFLRGELDKLRVFGKLEVLPSTNLYYILSDSPITTDNRLKELVTFVDLSNGEKVTVTRPTIDGMTMNMNISVLEGAHVKCWLNTDHTNYIDLIGNGDLRMTFEREKMSLNGRYTISQGEMKYSLPIIPLKTFTIADGSFLEWSGDLMNPRLSITATEEMKSSVNVNGVNQMVTFHTGVILSKTLNDMGLEFIVSAPENQTVSDELDMRSAEERGKLAVTLLTTGMYLTDGNTSSFTMNSALNSFLQSEINNLAGNALKTIDLSFGMESSTEQDGTMHNDYTFKFAKRFWNNRLSISVGGKISSGPDVSGQNKSFFNNVELQYRLSETSNKYMHMYYKRAVYDYLEGYLGQYGAGYLWKKKAQTFKGIFTNEPLIIPTMQRQPATSNQGTLVMQRQATPNDSIKK